LKKESNYINI